MKCNDCAFNCQLKIGEVGKCLVIHNNNGILENKFYGQLSQIALEPIEKKPFFHFYPGHKFLSIAGVGCQFSCQFCFNFQVSQSTDALVSFRKPEDLAHLALEKNAKGIAFSFNEPTVYWKYVKEVADLFPNTVVKTNGYAANHVLEDLAESVSAFNVDIKGNDEDYRKICGATLDPVLKSIETLFKLGVHLEISYLVVPSRVFDNNFHTFIRDFLCKFSANIPVHILYFYPFLRMKNDSYHPNYILEIFALFSQKMPFVYISNLHNSDTLSYRDTKCPVCGKIMISRQGKIHVNTLKCCDVIIKG